MAGIAQLFANVGEFLKVGYPDLQTAVGVKSLANAASPPRVTWIITSGAHSAAEKIGRRNGRSLLTRQVEVVAHVWGADFEQLEVLLEDVIAALYQLTHGSITFNGEEWPSDDEMSRGLVALVRFSLSGPVLERRFKVEDRAEDQRPITAKVTAIDADTSTSAQGDGAIDWKET